MTRAASRSSTVARFAQLKTYVFTCRILASRFTLCLVIISHPSAFCQKRSGYRFESASPPRAVSHPPPVPDPATGPRSLDNKAVKHIADSLRLCGGSPTQQRYTLKAQVIAPGVLLCPRPPLITKPSRCFSLDNISSIRAPAHPNQAQGRRPTPAEESTQVTRTKKHLFPSDWTIPRISRHLCVDCLRNSTFGPPPKFPAHRCIALGSKCRPQP